MCGTTVSQKSQKTRFIVNRFIFIDVRKMALKLCLNIKQWLNVSHTLLRADYIGLLMFQVSLDIIDNWHMVVDAFNLRMFLASLVYKE